MTLQWGSIIFVRSLEEIATLTHDHCPPAGRAVTFSLQLEKVTKKSRRWRIKS